MKQTQIKLEKFTRFWLYAVAFIPLIFVEGFFYPFVITKTLFFRLCIHLAMSGYILLLASNFKRYKPKFNIGLVLFLIFLVVNFLAGLLGIDFYKSFWSGFERMEGIVSLIYVFIYLFLLVNLFNHKRYWNKKIRLILVVSLISSLYAIIQRFDILPVFEAGIGRAAGTLGNAAFLAGFSLLSCGLAIYQYFKEDNKWYKNIALLAVFINLFVIFLTSTRGAILGVFVGFFIFLILSIFVLPEKRKYSIIAILIVIVISSLFYFNKDKIASSKIDSLRRMANISLTQGSIKNRLLSWEWAIRGVKEKPILGYGGENYNAIYNKHFTARSSEDWFDRTHNIYLDQLVNAGIVGFISYLSILFYLFYRIFKARKNDKILFLVFVPFFIAYAIHNFFVFDVLSTFLFFVFIIGFLSFDRFERQDFENKGVGLFNTLFLVILIANVFLFSQLIFKPFKQNRDAYIGYYHTLADRDLSYESYKKALDPKFGSAEIASQLYNSFKDLSNYDKASTDEKARLFKLTKEKLKFAVNNYKYDLRPRLYYAELILDYSNDPKEIKEAEVILQDAIKKGPERPESVYFLFNLYLNRNEIEKAKKVVEDFIQRAPWFGEAKIVYANAFWELEKEKSKEYFEEGIKQFYRKSEFNYKSIIAYLIKNERHTETEEYYLKLFVAKPENYNYRIDLSKIYYMQERFDEAFAQINIVQKESPNTIEKHREYINSLNF